jgi:23S rRNA pseudouridine1911/1915/1917 synthase
MDILFEDNHLIAVNKKPSEIVQGDKTGDKPMSDELKIWLKNKYAKPGEAYLGVIHRLDRPVSGVVLFAKTEKALRRMNEQFRGRHIRKTYWAVVNAPPPSESSKLIHWLRKNEQNNKSYVSLTDKHGYLRSELDYQVLASSDRYHLLEVLPLTGRHHQIRVQLSAIGCIIKGDLKYGAKRSNTDASIHLHARQLEFTHPVKQELIVITAPAPEKDTVWRVLSDQVKLKSA